MSSKSRRHKDIVVLGAGNFGTCLAQHLAQQGYSVKLWSRSADVAQAINSTRKNPKYLTTITLSPRISATHIIDEALLSSGSVLVLATPTQGLREVLNQVRPHFRDELLVVCAAKGIELSSLALPMSIIGDSLGQTAADRAVTLSGPSFAEEIVKRQPTAVAVASQDIERCQWAQEIFHAAHFRTYTSQDPTGLEVAGALKNIIAIAAGASRGIGFQMNSSAALITRGLGEITRIGVALGANPLTFTGLGGVGDLFLTCTSEKSRNFSVGFRLGKGETLEHIRLTMGSVAEGITTAKAAYELAAKLGVQAPIIDEVYAVLYQNKPIAQAVTDLLTRDAKPELELSPQTPHHDR